MPGGPKKKIAKRRQRGPPRPPKGAVMPPTRPRTRWANVEAVRAGADFDPRERCRKEGAHELLQTKVAKEVRDRPSVWVRRRRAAVRLQK